MGSPVREEARPWRRTLRWTGQTRPDELRTNAFARSEAGGKIAVVDRKARFSGEPCRPIIQLSGRGIVGGQAGSLGAVDLSDAPFVDDDLNGAEAKSADAVADQFQPDWRQRSFRCENSLSFRLH